MVFFPRSYKPLELIYAASARIAQLALAIKGDKKLLIDTINSNLLTLNLNDAAPFAAIAARSNRVPVSQWPETMPIGKLPNVDAMIDQPLHSVKDY